MHIFTYCHTVNRWIYFRYLEDLVSESIMKNHQSLVITNEQKLLMVHSLTYNQQWGMIKTTYISCELQNDKKEYIVCFKR